MHPDVLTAQAGSMIGHRGDDIQRLMAALAPGLQDLFCTSRPVLISTSSATGLMEAAVRNGAGAGRILSLVNGAFSARFAEIARTCGYDVERWEVDWGDVHDPAALEEKLDSSAFDAVTLSHSETSTGALQDLESISAVVRRYEDTLLLVDSVTGIGGVETWPDDWGVDFILTGSQKALALPPGLAFGAASEAMMARSRESTSKGWYFDLDRLAVQLESDQTPATPAISLLYSLDVQLERIAVEGVKQRWQRHLDMQAMTLAWVERMHDQGLEIGVFARDGHRSPTVTTVALPDHVSSAEVVGRVRSEGWVIGAGYGKIKDSTIRIGHMGDHTTEELAGLLDVLTRVMT